MGQPSGSLMIDSTWAIMRMRPASKPCQWRRVLSITGIVLSSWRQKIELLKLVLVFKHVQLRIL